MSLHVECGFAGGGSQTGRNLPVEVGRALAWSETVAAAGTTSNATPAGQSQYILTLTAEVDMWVAIAESPSAGVNPRRRLKAGMTRSFAATAGDKVAWAAA